MTGMWLLNVVAASGHKSKFTGITRENGLYQVVFRQSDRAVNVERTAISMTQARRWRATASINAQCGTVACTCW